MKLWKSSTLILPLVVAIRLLVYSMVAGCWFTLWLQAVVLHRDRKRDFHHDFRLWFWKLSQSYRLEDQNTSENAIKQALLTKIQTLFFNKSSLDCCKLLVTFQSSEKVNLTFLGGFVVIFIIAFMGQKNFWSSNSVIFVNIISPKILHINYTTCSNWLYVYI